MVVGGDESISYTDIQRATRLVHAGARFVATNPDGSFSTPKGPAAAVAAAAGRSPDITAGKPHPAMFETALAGLPVEPERVAVLGDNPYTDILGAHRAGLTAVLVSAEPSRFPSAGDHRAADAAIADLREFYDPELTVRRWRKPSFPWPDSVKAGVAAVILDRRGRVLLVRRVDNGLWGLPSGHLEPGETVTEAVAREVLEETSLEVEVERLVGVYSEPVSQAIRYPTDEVIQFVTSCCLCTISGGDLRTDGVEVSQAAFFERRELPKELMTMHPRWLDDALAAHAIAFIR